jgi:hypothetical protein
MQEAIDDLKTNSVLLINRIGVLEVKLKESETLKEKLGSLERDLTKLKEAKSPKAKTITVDNELNYTVPLSLYTKTRAQLEAVALHEYNNNGTGTVKSEFTVGDTKVSAVKHALFKNVAQMREALLLIEAILKQNDILAPVTDQARAEFAKYKALLMTLVSQDRPDRLIYAYESLTTKLFAATIVDGVRKDPIGWTNAREHLARIGEERPMWPFENVDWDQYMLAANLDPAWIKSLKGAGNSGGSGKRKSASDAKVATCRGWNSTDGCKFSPNCKFKHECDKCGKQGESAAYDHDCAKK